MSRLFSLPLFAKELIEQAARRRTYVLRVVYGLLLYVCLLGPESRFFRPGSDVLSILGQGKQLFEMLVGLQLGGIALFLPAMMSGRITEEKERDSLVLLMLTDLSPAQIVLQKYFAGLMPMITFLLLGLPMAGVAYSFGGVSAREIAICSAALVFSLLQVGAIALWCSTLFRHTVGAFLGTYFIGLAFYGSLPMLDALAHELHKGGTFLCNYSVVHIPLAMLDFFPGNAAFGTKHWIMLAANTASIFLFLGLAIYTLPRRAFAPPRRRFHGLFVWFDGLMRRWNRLLGGIRFGSKSRELPGDEPIAWRARHTSLLGRPNHLVRVLVALEIPTVVICLVILHNSSLFTRQEGLSMFGAVAGSLAVLVLAVVASNAVVTERVNQSLEVLLTTPMSAADIVRQKARSLRGLAFVLAVPLATIFGFEAAIEHSFGSPSVSYTRAPSPNPMSTPLYVTGVVLTLGIYLSLVAWLSIWIGLMGRTRIRAIFGTLAAIVGWCAGPALILAGVLEIDPTNDHGGWLYFASPIMLPAVNEFGEWSYTFNANPWVIMLANFAFYGAVLLILRRRCLEKADDYLRRR